MSEAYFFGYGSLVNAATHEFAPVFPARAKGWRRAWVATPERSLCYLSAVADPQGEIDGLIAPVPPAGWEGLDAREAAYERHDETHRIDHGSGARTIALYAVAPARHATPGPDNPILLSYLDTVIQGYRAVFGDAGVQHFFETTDGWHAPVLNDRAKPVYSRATPPSPQDLGAVDDGLATYDVRFISAD